MGLQENLLRGIYAYGIYWQIDPLSLSAYYSYLLFMPIALSKSLEFN